MIIVYSTDSFVSNSKTLFSNLTDFKFPGQFTNNALYDIIKHIIYKGVILCPRAGEDKKLIRCYISN